MSNTWSTYLKNHGTYKAYNQNCGSISTIIKPKDSVIANFRLLCENPTLVLMTMNQLGPQIQTSHSFSIIGNTLTNTPPRLMGLTGFGDRAIPIQFDDKNIFPPPSTATPAPTFQDLIKIRTIKDTEELIQTNQNNKKKIKSFCVLPPFLTSHLYSGINDPKQILVNFVQAIIDSTISSSIEEDTEETSQAIQTTTENETDTRDDAPVQEDGDNENQEYSPTFPYPSGEVEDNFYHILLFLWAVIHKQDKIQALATIPATDTEASEWSDNVHFISLRKPPSTNPTNIDNALADGVDRALIDPENAESMTGVASALTKVAQTMNKDMELKLLEKSDAKQKEVYKNFHSLSRLTQTTLCTASAYITTPDDDEYDPEGEEGRQITIPAKPNKFLLETIACKTGAAAREHFHHHLNKNMIDIDIGMCTSIKNGLFISQPTVSDINTFSINFVPPPSDDHSTEYDRNEDARIMETSKNGKLTHADVEKQTKHKNKYAKNYDELRHFTKNWADLNELLWSSRSILSVNLRQLSTHINAHELDYRRAFSGAEYFGAYYQQKVHTTTQKFLRSCAHGDPSMLNFRALDLSHLLKAIEDNEIVVKIPTWIKPDSALTSSKRKAGRTGNTRNSKRNKTEENRVDNPDKDKRCLIRNDEVFHVIFSPICKDGMDQPKQNDGKEMCNKFHGRGWCNDHCQRGHKPHKLPDEKQRWITFLSHCRKNAKEKKPEIEQMLARSVKSRNKG